MCGDIYNGKVVKNIVSHFVKTDISNITNFIYLF